MILILFESDAHASTLIHRVAYLIDKIIMWLKHWVGDSEPRSAKVNVEI